MSLIVDQVQWKSRNGLGALIISPTRELAVQIHNELTELCKHHQLSHGLIMGGSNRAEEARRLVKGVNILVCERNSDDMVVIVVISLPLSPTGGYTRASS